MSVQNITMTIGVTDAKGVVRLNIVGRQLVRAILYKYMCQAQKGETAAREMRLSGNGRMKEGQEVYFRNAGSFLGQRVACQVTEKICLGEELRLIAGWGDDVDLPDQWLQYITNAEQMEEYDGAHGPVDSRGGIVRVGQTRKPTKASKRSMGKADGKDRRRRHSKLSGKDKHTDGNGTL